MLRLFHFTLELCWLLLVISVFTEITLVILLSIQKMGNPSTHPLQRVPQTFIIHSPSTTRTMTGIPFASSHLITGHIRPKRILLWTKYYAGMEYWSGVNHLATCDLPCTVTSNRSDIALSDAVLFHAFETKLHDMPAESLRRDGQMWVMVSREPPLRTVHSGFDPRNFTGVFNWTMTFRHDSDVFYPYGSYTKLSVSHKRHHAVNNNAVGRTRNVIAMITRCGAVKRLRYVHELSRHIDVDLYGRCGRRMLCRDKKSVKVTAKSRNCVRRTMRTYKFYLAFENSAGCVDYITEKYWNAWRTYGGIVPVVMGSARDSYERIAIPGSYIHVDDFESPGHLAEYLHRLDADDALYNRYFQWQKYYVAIPGYRLAWCGLCTKMHSANMTRQVYNDLQAWWQNCVEN